jgi:hypothetical protein
VQAVQDIVHRNVGPGVDARFADGVEIGESDFAVNLSYIENGAHVVVGWVE